MRAIHFFLFVFSLLIVSVPASTQAQGVDQIFWGQEFVVATTEDKLGRMNLDGSNPVDLILGQALGIDIDQSGEKLYFSAGGSIWRSNLDGSSVERAFYVPMDPWGIAIDPISRKIYWVSFYDNGIRRANLDGSSMELLYTAGDSLVGIALDVIHGTMYVSEPLSDRVTKLNLDGSSPTVLPISPDGPFELVVDSIHNKLFIAVTNSDSIMVCNLDGSNSTSFASPTQKPQSVDVDRLASKVYWIGLYDDIYRANYDGSNQELVSSAPTGYNRALKLDIDRDGDGARNSVDFCPSDPNKTIPLWCGCGFAETDSDSDGMPDCVDICPSDSRKILSGTCGCGVPDVDPDGDGTMSCNEACVNDPKKTAVGICGCGTTDIDSNNNSITDCLSEESVQLRAYTLREQINAFALNSAGRKRKQIKSALANFESAVNNFPATGTDVAKSGIQSVGSSVVKNVNALVKVQLERGTRTQFNRAQRKSKQAIAAVTELLATAR